MNIEMSQLEGNIISEKEMLEESPKSNGFLYMDMNVYNEDEDSLESIKIKEEEISFEEDKPDNEENHLNSVSHDESDVDISNGAPWFKTKKNVGFSSKSVRKKNILAESNEKVQKRYTLRARTASKKLIENHPERKKSTKSYNQKQIFSCAKCSKTFSNKLNLNIHKTVQVNFRCSVCKKCFCSEKLLDEHKTNCKSKTSNSVEIRLSCEICEVIIRDKCQLENHFNVHESLFIKCLTCSKFFADKFKLENHIFVNECCSFDIYTCDICKQTFTQMSVLRKHISNHVKSTLNEECCDVIVEGLERHNGTINKPHTCHMCKKSFLQSSRLKIHLLQHQGIAHTCSKCNKLFPTQKSLDGHLNEGNCSSTVQKCDKCGKVYRSSVNYKKHLKSHKDNLMKCKNCNRVFIDSLKFSEHLDSGDCPKSEDSYKHKFKYECDECGSKFIKLVKLKLHILNVHQGINYQCEKCSLKFTCQKDFDAHALKECCKPEEPCTCKICGKVFAKKDYLKKHQYMHTNVLFKCKYCYCAFMKEKNYKRHMEKMNCSKSARKIRMAEFNFRKCRLCEVEYETEELLIEHFGASHSGQDPHQCFCCESCLPTFRDLQNHIHHHNIQKYTCNLCGKPYTSQEGFRKHRLKHKGAEFKCRYCDSEFLNESRFKFHEKTCKKNPESGYEPSQDKEKPKKKDERPKQSRQLHWESRIIMKHLRGDPKSSFGSQEGGGGNKNDNSVASTFFDEPETETTNERGWFDNYYKTEEDDIAFGLKKDNETSTQDCDSDFDVTEFLQTGSIVKKKKTNPPVAIATRDSNPVDDYDNGAMDNYSESSSEDSFSDSSEEESVEEADLPIDYNPKKCRLCVITFGQEYELLHHFIKSHPGEFAHKCPDCGTQSPLFAQLKEHMKTHGIGIGVFNCDNCSKKFKSEKKMKSHNIRCKGMNSEIGMLDSKTIFRTGEEHCKKCGKKFHTKFGYRRHKQLCKGKKNKNKKSSGGPGKPKQEPVFADFADANDFQLSDPEPEPQPNKSKPEPQVSELKNSTAGQTENPAVEAVSKPPAEEKKKSETKDSYAGEPPMDSFPCRLCDKKFQYERGIVMHFKSAHPGNKPLICHVCNMHLADKLKEHLKTHGIGEEFICELCGKRFNQKFLSKIHEMWHQGIEYKCNNCKQKFLNKEKMDKHIGENRCSNRQSLMRLPCDICGKSYRSKFGLSKHYITHTPKELRPVKNRMNCEYCGKWFENNNGLQRHRRIHTGERPFCCRFCPKAFAQEGNCKAHERIHTGESKPRKKKPPPCVPLPAPVPPPPPPPPAIPVDPVPYPTQINLYIYNNIDPSGIVH